MHDLVARLGHRVRASAARSRCRCAGASREWRLFAVAGSTSRTYRAFTRATPGEQPAGRCHTGHDDSSTSTIRNGVDTQQMFGTLDAIGAQPELGAFTFRATNRWIDGAHNRSTIKGFYGAGGEDTTRTEAFLLDAGEPAVLLGTDTGPNPAEYLLHALAACLTTTLVYSAAARKVRLTEVESTFEGDMDVRGCLGLDDASATASPQIRAHVPHQGRRARPRSCARSSRTRSKRSAVFDMVTNGVPVAIEAVTE